MCVSSSSSRLMRLDCWLFPFSNSSEASASASVAVQVPTTLQAWNTKMKTKTTTVKKYGSGTRLGLVHCTPIQLNPENQPQQPNNSQILKKVEEESEGEGIICEPCKGKGWLVCYFCKGQKTNVKAANNRIYRRCPDCRAVGYVLCAKCKVFKCVTYPDSSDGQL